MKEKVIAFPRMTHFQTTRFGRYELLERVSVGGMYTVYRARDTEAPDPHRLVAVKQLHDRCAGDSAFLEVFRVTARRAMACQHDNVIQVLDFGDVAGTYFLVQEWVDGQVLRQAQHRFTRAFGMKRLPAHLAVRIAIDLCRGLHHVHTQLELLQVELSPGEVLLGLEGEVKVYGFELHREMLSRELGGVFRPKLTYLSPEQISGDAKDARSDVYLAGVVVYQMLCGALHIDGDHDFARLEQIREGRLVPARMHNPSLDDGLVAILERAMATRPEDRYPSAESMQQALSEWLDAHAPGLHPGTLKHWMSWLYQDELARRGREFSLPLGFLAQLESWRASAQAGRSNRPSA
ncbi:serine/threonine protein kinase [Pyxidicoccus parkwayensis]|uniref:Serine/threonine protein kinase n=1 Tax=Pyxidicoccus parkwayensis TaxID=2813578 RepID=A0ABX7P679_9BACT|nr:serine/threonine-protein kinase [Pyxidicoccus parkwaysis]QSQ25985.1 serine/threonine protein kinase [Pyxidicoccus parkwaysis]